MKKIILTLLLANNTAYASITVKPRTYMWHTHYEHCVHRPPPNPNGAWEWVPGDYIFIQTRFGFVRRVWKDGHWKLNPAVGDLVQE